MAAVRIDLPSKSTRDASGVLFLRGLNPLDSPADEVPLRFLAMPDGVVVLSRGDDLPGWAQTLLASRRASWRIGESILQGWVEPVVDRSELAHAIDAFRGRFGGREVDRWFGGSVAGFRLHSGPADERGSPSPESYFDQLAAEYDRLVLTNPLDLYLRSVAGAVLGRIFPPGAHILEIGCGTGIETLPLARRGVRIAAIDISGEMLARLSEKAAGEGLSSMIEPRKMDAKGIDAYLREGRAGTFDGAFSDFGALNCEPDLGRIPEILHRLLRPGGSLVLGIWNRYCASEALLALASGNPRRALARLQVPVRVGHSRFGIPVYARGPSEFLEPFRPFFETVERIGLPVFLPPYDFGGPLPEYPELFDLLSRLDTRLADKFPFNRLGDHFLVELRRRP